MQVERLTLEVEWAGHPSVAPADQKLATQAKWKPNPVAMWLPAETPATKVGALDMHGKPRSYYVPGMAIGTICALAICLRQLPKMCTV